MSHKRILIPEPELRHLYIGLEQPATAIAEVFGCSSPIVVARLKEYAIPNRTLKEAKNTAPSINKVRRRLTGNTFNKGRYKFLITRDELYHRYVGLQQSASDIAKEIGCSYPTILGRLTEYQIPIRSGREAHNIQNYRTKFETELPETELRRLYVDQQMGVRGIGVLCNCSANCVRNNLRRRGIPIRTRKEAQATPACTAGRAKAIAKGRTQEAREHKRKLNNERYKDPREKEKTGFATRQAFLADPTIITRRTASLLATHAADPLIRQRSSEQIKKYWSDPENRRRKGEVFRAMWSDPEYRERQVRRRREFWASGSPELIERRKKMIAGLNLRPNKPETAVFDLLEELFPSEWKYMGDGQVIIGGLNPDFININGKKLIVEVFGDYWHTQKLKPYRINEGRREVYAAYGYRTLIIWERETKKNLDELNKKVTEFVAGIGADCATGQLKKLQSQKEKN